MRRIPAASGGSASGSWIRKPSTADRFHRASTKASGTPRIAITIIEIVAVCSEVAIADQSPGTRSSEGGAVTRRRKKYPIGTSR